MNHYRLLAKVRPPTPPAPPPIEQNINISHALSTTDTETRAKGGRAVGMTNEKKRSIELALVGAKNEITTRLETLDYLEVFARSTGINPYMLLGGHGSRMGLPFLRYINDPAYLWIACIGVPYGTSLWQVGDAAEQNSAYKGGLTTMKKKNRTQNKAAKGRMLL